VLIASSPSDKSLVAGTEFSVELLLNCITVAIFASQFKLVY